MPVWHENGQGPVAWGRNQDLAATPLKSIVVLDVLFHKILIQHSEQCFAY